MRVRLGGGPRRPRRGLRAPGREWGGVFALGSRGWGQIAFFVGWVATGPALPISELINSQDVEFAQDGGKLINSRDCLFAFAFAD